MPSAFEFAPGAPTLWIVMSPRQRTNAFVSDAVSASRRVRVRDERRLRRRQRDAGKSARQRIGSGGAVDADAHDRVAGPCDAAVDEPPVAPLVLDEPGDLFVAKLQIVARQRLRVPDERTRAAVAAPRHQDALKKPAAAICAVTSEPSGVIAKSCWVSGTTFASVPPVESLS
jgi:hypothetical protein